MHGPSWSGSNPVPRPFTAIFSARIQQPSPDGGSASHHEKSCPNRIDSTGDSVVVVFVCVVLTIPVSVTIPVPGSHHVPGGGCVDLRDEV